MLIEVKIEGNNVLLARVSPKSSGIYTILIRHTNTFTVCLGHASIIESEYKHGDRHTFTMDFRIKHPLLGEVFCYKGQFVTQIETKKLLKYSLNSMPS